MRRGRAIKVGITTGDLNGIGLELFIRTFSKPGIERLCTPVLFGCTKAVSHYKKKLGIDLKVLGIKAPEEAVVGAVNCVNVWQKAVYIEMGKPSKIAGAHALESLAAATEALERGLIDVLVTAPIDKYSIQHDDFHFPGHTEYLECRLMGKSLMFLVSEELKVALATGHIPLAEVAHSIDETVIRDKLDLMSRSLEGDFGCHKPRIAVLSLDPHGGDQGVIGDWDQHCTTPLINTLFDEGRYVFGPYPADGFFGSGMYRNFDAVLAMYHDQGLTPFKTLTFGRGVNFTAGLNRIRTSPDHGTAYDLVGKGTAMTDSYQQAIFTAIDIYNNRQAQTKNSEMASRK